MSPQSRMRAHDVYGFRPARGLKPRKEVWRALAARMARGPNLAPGNVNIRQSYWRRKRRRGKADRSSKILNGIED